MMLKPLPLQLVMGIGSAGALATGITLHAMLRDWRWHAEPLHSAMEAVGGLAAIAMAIVLLQREDEAKTKFLPPAVGFLGMGMLEEFHAISAPGNGFILLRSVASFVGAIGFSLVWLPESRKAQLKSQRLLWVVAGGSCVVGMRILIFPDEVPDMIRNGEFTPTAVAPQSFAATLFLASALRFTLDYRRSGKTEDYLFACLAFMFALAEVMFMYSTPWDSRWWFWHLIRLMAYLLVFAYVVRGYRRMVSDLKVSLAQTTRTEETLRLSEQHLRRVLEARERMAQDLHDGIIQSVFALGLSLERCRRLVTKDPQETIGQLDTAIANLKLVIRDLRGYITGLEPEIANGRGLEAALASLVRTVEGSHDLHCLLQIDPMAADRVTPEQATHIVYIAREAISNSLRHANAREERVLLQLREGGVRLVVEDDGAGFNPQASEGRGDGLRNMAARAKKLGAQLAFVSEPGHGTRVVFDLPTEPVHA